MSEHGQPQIPDPRDIQPPQEPAPEDQDDRGGDHGDDDKGPNA